MARVKIDPPDKFPFSTNIPIRITDINYGDHVGNDTVLSIVHEARVKFYQHLGFSELNFGGVGTIMSDAAIEYKDQIYYGDEVTVSVAVGEITKVSFELFYKLEKKTADRKQATAALVKTGIICYNYDLKKITSIPAKALEKITNL